MDKVLLSTGKDDWETPIQFFNKLNEEFKFTLDPCCGIETAKCSKFYTKNEDGLKQNWENEIVYVNPPYSKKTKDNPGQEAWIKKCYEEGQRTIVVMLLPARTDTIAFHKYIYGKAEIRFLKGRLKFVGAKATAPFPSMVVIFRPKKDIKAVAS